LRAKRSNPALPPRRRTSGSQCEAKDSSFSEEKEAKRLSPLARVPDNLARVPTEKSFLVLFFKKEPLPLRRLPTC
jgi:hypothetical protein